MRILHLSDLHLSGDHRNFSEVSGGAEKIFREKYPDGFDAIVVSGDLTYRASTDEYQALKKFVTDRLLKRLREGAQDRWRVVFVPGNHDVAWGANIGEQVPLSGADDKTRATVDRDLRERRNNPGGSTLREVNGWWFGRTEYIRIDEARYPKRFENVHGFLQDFYAPVHEPSLFRGFNLLGDPQDHWSAHAFTKEKVTIFGFNSCHRNDAYWTGAEISALAVEAAAEWGEKHAKDHLWIAVWHHGLGAAPGRPDGVTLRDLGYLFTRGMRVGMHGHTHKAEAEAIEKFFGEHFLLVSTGSLGAPAKDRPGAVGNQFSVVEIEGWRVTVHLYGSEDEHGAYERKQPDRAFQLDRAHRTSKPPIILESHERAYTVDPDGILSASVTLRAKPSSPAPFASHTLAVLTPPFCEVQPDASGAPGHEHVTVTRLPGGKIEYKTSCEIQPGRALTWDYKVSNALALCAGEHDLKDDHTPWMPRLKPGWEGRTHTVRVMSDRLTLSVRYVNEDGSVRTDIIDPRAVRVIAERKARDDDDGWREDKDESERATEHATVKDGVATLDLRGPAVGHRYTLAFPLQPKLPKQSSEMDALQEHVLKACLGGHATKRGVADGLANAVTLGLKRLFGVDDEPGGPWLGLLWCRQIVEDNKKQPTRRLFPAFGRFTRPLWAVRFAYGDGVAGHAFRFNRPAAWHSEVAEPSLIFKKMLGIQDPIGRTYRWILCVPIFSKDGVPFGVVSFSGEQDSAQTQCDEGLERIARSLASRGKSDEVNSLWIAVSTSVWSHLAMNAWPRDRHKCGLAKRNLEALKGLTNGNSSPPPVAKKKPSLKRPPAKKPSRPKPR